MFRTPDRDRFRGDKIHPSIHMEVPASFHCRIHHHPQGTAHLSTKGTTDVLGTETECLPTDSAKAGVLHRSQSETTSSLPCWKTRGCSFRPRRWWTTLLKMLRRVEAQSQTRTQQNLWEKSALDSDPFSRIIRHEVNSCDESNAGVDRILRHAIKCDL